MEIKRCYVCFGTPVYVLGVPFLILLSELLFFVIFGLLSRNNLIVYSLIPTACHIIFRYLYKRSETWWKNFLFLLRIPFTKIYKKNVAYIPLLPKK